MKELRFNKIVPAVLIAALVLVRPVSAAFEFRGRGGRSGALGGAYTAISDDVEGLWWNPAGLRLADSVQVDTSYTALYGMSDLALINAAAVMPTLSLGTWGFGYSSFGFSDYRETDLRLAFSAGLADGIYLGTNLKSNSVSIEGVDDTGMAFGLDLGILANINENLRMGMSGYNINRPKMASNPVEYLQQRYKFGIYATPIEGVAASLDLHKVPDNDWEHRLGLEFPISTNLTLRTGIQSRPARFSMGFGFRTGIFNLNYSFRNHQDLDFQHEFALQTRFGETPTAERVRVPEEEVEIAGPEITVNINTASMEGLTEVPGIGETTARDIIEYREETGEFRSVRDLMRIYGFSRNLYNNVREYLTVDEETIIEREPVQPYQPEPEEDPETPPEPDPEPEEIPTPPEPEPEVETPEEPEEEPQEEVETQEEPEEEEEVDKFNLNQADAGQIAGVSGISYSLARNIVRNRTRQGGFETWDDVLRISGVNQRIVDNLKQEAVIE